MSKKYKLDVKLSFILEKVYLADTLSLEHEIKASWT